MLCNILSFLIFFNFRPCLSSSSITITSFHGSTSSGKFPSPLKQWRQWDPFPSSRISLTWYSMGGADSLNRISVKQIIIMIREGEMVPEDRYIKRGISLCCVSFFPERRYRTCFFEDGYAACFLNCLFYLFTFGEWFCVIVPFLSLDRYLG